MSQTQTVQRGDGVRIAYDTAGAGAPLLLIHGITENRSTWDDFAPRLADMYHVIRVDLRGHGDSDVGPDYSPPTMAGDVAAVVDALGVGPPHLVGHSLGGMVATVYAALFPARSVVNVDQSLQFADFAALVRTIVDDLRGDGYVDALNAEMDQLAGPALPESEKAHLRKMRGVMKQDVVLSLWEPLIHQTDAELLAVVEGLLPGITCPYLSLHGTDLGPDYAAWLTGLTPSAAVESWDGLGHWLFLVEPERFLQRVTAFLADVDAT